MGRMRWLTILGAVLLVVPGVADEPRSRGSGGRDWGVRLGVADDPDQIVFGAQYDFGEVAPDLHFEPNVELGFGDDHTILDVTLTVNYRFDVRQKVRPYVGGGLAVGVVDIDRGQDDDTELEIALKTGGGVGWPLRNRKEFFLEMLLGFGDLQDAEIIVGWRF